MVGIETVGFDNVGTGLEIGKMNIANNAWLGEYQQIVITLEITRPIPEALTPVIIFFERVGLDHGAHGAIQYQNALLKQLVEMFDALISVHNMPAEKWSAIVTF